MDQIDADRTDLDRTDPHRTDLDRTHGDRLEVIRSEERLRVESARRPYQRVVVRRRVVTETVVQQVEVQVRREVLEVERTPVEDAAGSLEVLPGEELLRDPLSPDAPVLEIVLHEERPVVGVQVVPVERVRIITERVRGEQTVSADLRSERVDVDVSGAAAGTVTGSGTGAPVDQRA